MRYTLLLTLLLFTLSAHADLLITSDSTVGIRAFQDQPPAKGQLVLKNTGNKPLKHIQLKISTPFPGVTLKNNTCSGYLLPGKTCEYTVSYEPKFKRKTQDMIRENFVSFLATASNSQDQYTLYLQAIAHNSWASTEKPSIGTSTAFLLKQKRGNANVIYSVPSGDGLVLRSTDGQHWSIFAQTNELYTSRLSSSPRVKYAVLGPHGHLYILFSDRLLEFDGKNWQVPLEWGDDPNYKNSATNLVIASNGMIYINMKGSRTDPHYQGILFFDGNNRWVLRESGCPAQKLLQINHSLYAVGPSGVFKLDGIIWLQIGKNNFATENSDLSDLLQTPDGNFYTTDGLSIYQYDANTQRWYGIAKNNGLGRLVFLDNALYITYSGEFRKYDPKTNLFLVPQNVTPKPDVFFSLRRAMDTLLYSGLNGTVLRDSTNSIASFPYKNPTLLALKNKNNKHEQSIYSLTANDSWPPPAVPIRNKKSWNDKKYGTPIATWSMDHALFATGFINTIHDHKGIIYFNMARNINKKWILSKSWIDATEINGFTVHLYPEQLNIWKSEGKIHAEAIDSDDGLYGIYQYYP